MHSGHQVTQILQELGDSPAAREELLSLVYAELRSIAGRRMAGERNGHTLQATVLVHEAYLRLVGPREMPWRDRASFFAAAAEAMRRILVDHARRRRSLKRGGDAEGVPLDAIELSTTGGADVVALSEALDRLEAEDPRAAEVVRLRFFAGLGVEETAAALEVSPRTVLREWSFARARLYQILEDDDAAAAP